MNGLLNLIQWDFPHYMVRPSWRTNRLRVFPCLRKREPPFLTLLTLCFFYYSIHAPNLWQTLGGGCHPYAILGCCQQLRPLDTGIPTHYMVRPSWRTNRPRVFRASDAGWCQYPMQCGITYVDVDLLPAEYFPEMTEVCFFKKLWVLKMNDFPFGCSPRKATSKMQLAEKMYQSKEYSVDQITEATGISKSTLYRYIK